MPRWRPSVLRRSGSRESIHALIRRSLCCHAAQSLRVNPMPPRTTQKSHRPRASHRMMVGTESQRLACVASQLIGVKRHCSMKPFNRDHRRELAIAAELHGDPKCENQSPLQEEGGLDASHHSGVSRRGVQKYFFLTSSLIG